MPCTLTQVVECLLYAVLFNPDQDMLNRPLVHEFVIGVWIKPRKDATETGRRRP